MRRTSGRALSSCLLLSAGLAGPARAQEVKPGGGASITIRGFVSGTFYVQDSNFGTGNGQRAEYVTQELDGWWHGGDVRSTRVTLAFASPAVVGEWKVNATAEMDFFGAFAANPPFGDEQPQPRLRVASVELTNGRTGLRVGQDWSLTLGSIPVSTSHLGFPLGWGSGGFIGWRFPGVWFSQELASSGSATTATLRLAVLKNSWTGSTNPELPGAGEAGLPQLEGRLDFRGKTSGGGWNLYLVGHVDRKDLNGVRPEGAPEPESDDLTAWAGEAGGRIDAGRLSLLGNAYVGRAMGHHFASIVQFGDIQGWGAWAQAGVTLAPHWSLWGYFGTDDPSDDDVFSAVAASDAARLNSWLVTPMLRFQAGPYALGLEWLHSRTTVAGPVPASGGIRTESDLDGNQVLFSVLFNF